MRRELKRGAYVHNNARKHGAVSFTSPDMQHVGHLRSIDNALLIDTFYLNMPETPQYNFSTSNTTREQHSEKFVQQVLGETLSRQRHYQYAQPTELGFYTCALLLEPWKGRSFFTTEASTTPSPPKLSPGQLADFSRRLVSLLDFRNSKTETDAAYIERILFQD